MNRAGIEEFRLACAGHELYARLRPAPEGSALIVMLCGTGFHSFEYEPLADLLAAERVGCLSFDYRGHGQSSGARGRWALADLEADARCVLGHARRLHGGPIALYGNSLGAMVAIRVAAVEASVGAVVASNAPARIGDFMMTPARRALLAAAEVAARLWPLRVSLNHFYAYSQLIADPAWLDRLERDHRIGDARRLAPGAYRSLLDDWDGPAAARALHRPLLLLQGRRDAMQPPQQAQILYDAANQPKRLVFLDSGHLPQLEHPAVVRDALLAWLREHLHSAPTAALQSQTWTTKSSDLNTSEGVSPNTWRKA